MGRKIENEGREKKKKKKRNKREEKKKFKKVTRETEMPKDRSGENA